MAALVRARRQRDQEPGSRLRQRCRSACGKTCSTALIRPAAPSLMTSSGQRSPRAFRSWAKSAQAWVRRRGPARRRPVAVGTDPPGGQHRFGPRPRMHPEVAGVQEQIVQLEVVEAALPPPLELSLDRRADPRHGGLAERGLAAQRVGQGGLHVAPTARRRTRRSPPGFPTRWSWSPRPEQPEHERVDSAAQLGPRDGDRPRWSF